ncbi:hypothetical protein MSAN_01536300 [Mycena sanguinolenta]|uniref:Protein kinase domain-containing protein n=1 Tax=Mycena sanguinolenta TaxID=230812 RepID=A0A8H7CWU7_9AGAR|nr:hypothetical protein MSAN_01536300 [Mycena sanguinolenta]
MDHRPHSGPEFTAVSATNPISVESASYAGAFFPHAAGFNIRGGVFTSNVNIVNNVHGSPEEDSGFQRICLGDIKLVKEIRLDSQSAVIRRQTQGAGVRRMYSAEIRRDPRLMTVAMYQGDDIKEEWDEHLAKYEAIRHPNVMQLYALMTTERLRAMVFHDEVIPYNQFLRRFQDSPILRRYIIGYCGTEFDEAINYLSDAFQKPAMHYNALPVWIRPTTGELCLDLVQGSPTDFGHPWWKAHVFRSENILLDDPYAEAAVISKLTEDEHLALATSGSLVGEVVESEKEKPFPTSGRDMTPAKHIIFS